MIPWKEHNWLDFYNKQQKAIKLFCADEKLLNFSLAYQKRLLSTTENRKHEVMVTWRRGFIALSHKSRYSGIPSESQFPSFLYSYHPILKGRHGSKITAGTLAIKTARK
jgi:hypothetical protein